MVVLLAGGNGSPTAGMDSKIEKGLDLTWPGVLN